MQSQTGGDDLVTNTLLTLHDPAAARRYYAAETWRDDTLYTLLQRHAAQRPDDFALRDATQRLAWRDLLKLVDAVAADLDASGLKRGERVAVWLPNCVEAVAVFLACSRNGYICNPSLHQNYTVAEIIELLTRTRAAALFAQPGYGADARAANIFAAVADLPGLRRVYARGEGTLDAAPFPDADSARPLPPIDDNPDKIVYLAFTSGTTGAPKGVMHSDNTLLANGRAMVEDWHHDQRSVLLSLSPMSHHIGTVAIGQMMAAGHRTRRQRAAARHDAARLDHRDRRDLCDGRADACDGHSRRDATPRLDKLGAVKTFYMAGSPIPREVAQAFLDRGVIPQNVYGMSENSSHQYTLPSDPAETIVATCGRACRAYEIRLWDQENPDVEVAPGEIGEIGGRGACLMLGYFDNQQATEDSFNRGGWFMSGDLGRLDENGCLEIVGRKKDLIIRGGRNIHPAQDRRPGDAPQGGGALCRVRVSPTTRLGEKVCLSVIFHEGEAVDRRRIAVASARGRACRAMTCRNISLR